MELIHIVVLALLQGLTEFLPISSSAHLIIFPKLLGWPIQDLAFDVAVHVGTLSAVMYYFRHEIREMVLAWLASITQKQHSPNSFLAWAVLFGTIPLGITGLLIKDFVEGLRDSPAGPLVIATTTIVFGLALWWADSRAKQQRDEYQLTVKDVIVIGCAQAIALIPGTSRSGITITAGIMMGLNRKSAARFSFLLSIPAILLPGLLKTKDLVESDVAVVWSDLFLGIVISGISAYLCIHYFLKMLEKLGMFPFVVYRLVLGVLLFAVFGGNFKLLF